MWRRYLEQKRRRKWTEDGMLWKKKELSSFSHFSIRSEGIKGRKRSNGTAEGKEESGVERDAWGRDQGAWITSKYLVWVNLTLQYSGLMYEQ